MNAKILVFSAVAAVVIVGCMIVPENKPADTAPPSQPATATATTTAVATTTATARKRSVMRQVPKADAGALDGG